MKTITAVLVTLFAVLAISSVAQAELPPPLQQTDEFKEFKTFIEKELYDRAHASDEVTREDISYYNRRFEDLVEAADYRMDRLYDAAVIHYEAQFDQLSDSLKAEKQATRRRAVKKAKSRFKGQKRRLQERTRRALRKARTGKAKRALKKRRARQIAKLKKARQNQIKKAKREFKQNLYRIEEMLEEMWLNLLNMGEVKMIEEKNGRALFDLIDEGLDLLDQILERVED